MSDSDNSTNLAHAYHQMMERVKVYLEELEQAEKEALPQLHASIQHAAEKAVELDELTREEAHLIGTYLKRDIADAEQYLSRTGHDFRAWLRFDLELLEDRFLDFFQRGVDQSRLDLRTFKTPPADSENTRYYVGEVTAPGTLQCQECGELIAFHAPAAIGACLSCGGTCFVRITEEV